ncbi:MAG: hypothetical protein DRI86_05660 [Bacteroidetes bacterium]|nr:MAG: hypothetical protein DRI86_05660 [Bacteroidota bacterium]
MSLSQNSYSTTSNIIFGSDKLPKIWVNAQTFVLPTITLSPPQINNRSGALIALASDVVDYGDLSVDLILDKEWKVWDDLYKFFIQELDVTKGNFLKQKTLDIFIEYFDGSGESRKKFQFYNCRLMTFGEVQSTTTDQEDPLNFLNVTFLFDYMEDMSLQFRDSCGSD